MERPYRILLIEPDPDMAGQIAAHLREQGTWVTIALDCERGLAICRNERFDLILLDLDMPDRDGLAICKELRNRSDDPPIILIAPQNDPTGGVAGLEMGADSFVTQPFTMRELSARIKAVLRRATSTGKVDDPPILRTRGLEVVRTTRTVTQNGRHLTLTPKEFDLLWYFASNPGRVFTRAQLLDAVWVYGHDGYEHTVNSHINRLRAKVEPDPTHPIHILTVWGVGYKFAEDERPTDSP